MRQSRRMSAVEGMANAAVGLVVSWLFTMYGLPLFGLVPSPEKATGITACYFALSWGRSYALRRLFETCT